MTDNERISKVRFDIVKMLNPRTPYFQPKIPYYQMGEFKPFGWERCPDYSGDPAAWTPELYQWIENEGLWDAYLDFLCIVTTGYSLDRGLDIPQLTAMLKATPAQKAQALARAIEERS